MAATCSPQSSERASGQEAALDRLGSFVEAADVDFQDASLSGSQAKAVARKLRNRDKDLGATLGRSDESKTAITIPFCERGIDARMKGLTSNGEAW